MLKKLFLTTLCLILIIGILSISGCTDSNNSTSTPQKTSPPGNNTVQQPVIPYNDSVLPGESTGNVTLNQKGNVRITVKEEPNANDNDDVIIIVDHLDNSVTRTDVKGSQYKINDWTITVSSVRSVEVINNAKISIYVTIEPI